MKLRIGDCYSLPLPDGRYAYAQHVFRHQMYGDLVRISKVIDQIPVPAERLSFSDVVFPPVFTGVEPAVDVWQWKSIGHRDVDDFTFPTFRWRRNLISTPGPHHDWYLWDGEEFHFVGDLSPEHHHLEFLAGWHPAMLVQRIADGTNIYSQLL